MSILNSTYNSFIFNFTKSFVPQHIEDRWKPYVKRLPLPYDTVLTFLNSTIQAVNFPPIGMETVYQYKKLGTFDGSREKEFKNSKAVKDLFTRDLTITFKTTEGFANYWIIQEIILHYLDFENKEVYLEDFHLHMIDQDGYILSSIIFKEMIFTGMTGLNLSYADNVPEFKSFDVNFRFNKIKNQVTTG